MSNDTMPVDKGSLEIAIRKAFADTSPPADEEIIECPGDYEADQFYTCLVGKTWSQLLQELLETDDESNVRYFHAVYGFLTTVAFYYYLPTFMIVSLDPVRADTTAESLMFALSPMLSWTKGAAVEWHAQRFSAFASLVTPAQREVIRSFMLYLTDLAEELQIADLTDHKALRQYWFPEGFPRLSVEKPEWY